MYEVLLEKQNSLTIGLEKFGAGSYLASIEVNGKVLKSIKFTKTIIKNGFKPPPLGDAYSFA
jgi:hypothetical protein